MILYSIYVDFRCLLYFNGVNSLFIFFVDFLIIAIIIIIIIIMIIIIIIIIIMIIIIIIYEDFKFLGFFSEAPFGL